LPIFIFGLLIPSYIRKTLLFGVNIPEEILQSQKVKGLNWEYKRNFIVSYCITVAAIILLAFNREDGNILNIGIIAAISVFSLNYIYIHLKTKKLKADEGWLINRKQVVMVSTARSTNSKLLSVSMRWYLVPVVVVAFTWLFTMIMYPHLPEEIPLKVDMYGNIIRYSSKGLLSVFGMPLTQLGMLIMFLIGF